MAKRDLITEIQEKNSRTEPSYFRGSSELYSLETSFRFLTDSDATLISLHIVGICACLESGVRYSIKRLIDSGTPYIERAEHFKDHIKFDFQLTKALSENQITFGDLISHSIPVSKIEHIASHFENLFREASKNIKFSQIVSNTKQYVEPDDEEIFGGLKPGTAQENAPYLVEDPDTLINNISKIFEIRHLVAHEASFNAVSLPQLSIYLNSARLFCDFLYETVNQSLYPGASRNGVGMSIQYLSKAGAIRCEADEVQSDLSQQLDNMKSSNHELAEKFEDTCKAFENLYDAEVQFRLTLHGLCTGNAMRNIEARVTESLYSQRLKHLTELKDDIEIYR
ncbi:hypothetical protein [Pseudomonas sp. NPDC089406]|uniref:hypothetical protein n=1 Tax=Pseudomonas sp. NPDC089406 TaxID=3364463 RepID=UPI00384B9809